jgi:hypothetical protein
LNNDQFNGSGVLTYPNGDRYEGNFLDGVRTGNGTFSYADGRKYVGNWFKAPPPSKKSVFARKVEIKINAWEDSLESDLSETLWLFN